MGKVKKNDDKKTSINNTSSTDTKKVKKENSKPKEKVVKTTGPKVKKVDKDTLMNTPKEKESGVKIMPHDEETLRIFSLKKMNFKDMTGTQKTTLVVLCVFLGLFFLLMILPTLSSMFGGPNIGNLIFINREEEEEENKENEFALEGDYIVLGNNTYINIEGVKFYNFTKSSGYQLVYNYLPSTNVEDVQALKIYVEFYTHTKSLINRFAFTTESNTLTQGVQGIGQVEMSSNNFNKAYYVRVRVITDAVIEDLPDEDPGLTNPDNPGGSGSGSGSTGGGSGTGNGSTSTPNTDKAKLMICSKWEIDGSLKIVETMNVNFSNNKISSYEGTYVISSLIEGTPKNYSTYYKKMLNKHKKAIRTNGTTTTIKDEGHTATLTYGIDYSKYVHIEFTEEHYKLYTEKELEKLYGKNPYEAEIKKDSTRTEAKKQLEAVEWDCD